MVDTMRVERGADARGAPQGGFMAATDLADYLVGKGMPFREAHEVVGKLVLECEREGRTLQDLTAEEFAAAARRVRARRARRGRHPSVVERRTSEGGTATAAVTAQLAKARAALDVDDAWLEATGE